MENEFNLNEIRYKLNYGFNKPVKSQFSNDGFKLVSMLQRE